MAEQTSAFAAMRALRDDLRARLDKQEDYRAWKALDDALRDLDPRLPTAAPLSVETFRPRTGDDALVNFAERRDSDRRS